MSHFNPIRAKENTHLTTARLSSRLRRAVRLVCAMTTALVAACSGSPPNPNPWADLPLQTVPVDLPRYMGRWYVIANIPYFAERDFVGSRAEWVLRDDGRIDDHFYGRKGSFDQPEQHYQFVDTVVPGSGGGHWRVRLFWPVYVSQLTLYVDPDYRYTLLGYPDKSLGWIFSREPVMDDATYRKLLTRFDEMGYDTSRFRRVPQVANQMGQPGFASPGERD
ncbi:Outer membrane lipoprotein Blc [Pandoraea captiosa]|uniref:Outer membrane lipoprotein Blc n=2 Tax=Pandoraea captiosa TaxID=2508302 RepID=A0A5E4ZL82_9BURK|nr:Outer membrane lipoprotein Blc [Pandoraea captiosa]